MRVLVVLVGIVGLLLGSVWIAVASMVVLAIRYRAWEIVAIGLFFDFAWQPTGATFAVPVFTLLSIGLVWAFEPIRAQFLS